MTDFQHSHCHLIVEQNKNILLQEHSGFFFVFIVVICCDEVIAYGGDCHIKEEGSGFLAILFFQLVRFQGIYLLYNEPKKTHALIG